MKNYRWTMAGGAVLLLLGTVISLPAAEDKSATDATVFRLREVSILEEKISADLLQEAMFNGTHTTCTTKPVKGVKAWPKLNSQRPLYGAIIFDLNRVPDQPSRSTEFYFVLDESPAPQKADGKEMEGSKDPAKPRYDRLFFDADHDLDLTNDAVISLLTDPPKNFPGFGSDRWNVRFFNTLCVSLTNGPKATGHSTRLLPVLATYTHPRSGPTSTPTWHMGFMSASAWQGEVKLGSTAYQATLMQAGMLIGRLDHPCNPLVLTPVDGPKGAPFVPWLNTLGAIRAVGGEFYAITATPTGDRLTVTPVAGERGLFVVSAGKQDVKQLGAVGVLDWKGAMLPLGDFRYPYPMPAERAKVAKYRLPVGDYRLMKLIVDYGTLQIQLRAYDAIAAIRDTVLFDIEIRKDKPYILDFMGKAELRFQGPPGDKGFKPGEVVRVSAMLAIAEKGLLVTGLDDTSKQVGAMKWRAEDGRQMSGPSYSSLTPRVVITDSSGKKLAEGDMPFG